MQVNIGKGIELEVPAFDTLSQAVKDHIVYIGFRNILMDSHAGMTPEKANGGDHVELSKAIAEKKLAALVAGDLRTTSSREGDPVRAEAIRLAVKAVEGAIRKAGKKVADFDRKVIREKAVENMEKFMVQARKNVEATKALDVEIEI